MVAPLAGRRHNPFGAGGVILVFGQSGQVARALQPYTQVWCFGRNRVDFMYPGQADQVIRAYHPKAVINAAAYTDVDGAEADVDTAMQLNAHAVAEMAQTCATLGIPLVHISTDYVFDGSGDAPWNVTDDPAPINAYGRSKWAGEKSVQAAGGPHVILRTSWVFSNTGSNFVTTMRRLAQTRDHIGVVSDQIGGPTPADAIAAACINIADQLRQDISKTGTYHFAGTPNVSWADFARVILGGMGSACRVDDITGAQYPRAAARPKNSKLNCTTLQRSFGIEKPSWKLSL
ncbi:MAG: dTDP-4-dehydrorhamnose reductase [Planktomarina sp.]